ncbi:MAG: glycosyltransferase family 9 protein [Planctomycetota bacterium]
MTNGNRLLVVCPSWLGDAVMATPALRALRQAMPGAYIGALVRPGIDQILDGLTSVDEFHVDRPTGVFGPKRVAAKLRPRRYSTALLLTNSFSTALVTRVAGITKRVGYERDGRGFLLTHKLRAPERDDSSAIKRKWKVVPAVEYYMNAVRTMLNTETPTGNMELAVTERDEADAHRVRASLDLNEPFAILNPGGNNPAKRWPADRFVEIGVHLWRAHSLRPMVNGSPNEAELCDAIARGIKDADADANAASLPAHGNTIRALKALCRDASAMVTNDTGPRHIAAAFGTPVVSLFGPTDHRWTTIPTQPLADGRPSEAVLVADPTLPETELANDHPERCAVDRITTDRVKSALDSLLGA